MKPVPTRSLTKNPFDFFLSYLIIFLRFCVSSDLQLLIATISIMSNFIYQRNT